MPIAPATWAILVPSVISVFALLCVVWVVDQMRTAKEAAILAPYAQVEESVLILCHLAVPSVEIMMGHADLIPGSVEDGTKNVVLAILQT